MPRKMRIELVYSRIYDEMRKESPAIQKKLKELKQRYPTPAQIKHAMGKHKNNWMKEEHAIIKELTKITGLHWKEKHVKCYVVGFG